mgnify:CR=1 FL=1|jgi:hypothetical protein
MRTKLLPAFAALVLFAACGGNPWVVDSFEAPEANVAGRHSFVWRTGEVGAPLVKQPQTAADAQAQMRALIVDELLRKGYVETVDAAAADMVVSFQVTGARRFVPSDDRRIGAPSPNSVLTPGGVPPLPASELPRERSVREGTVVIFAEDPASGRIIWRGLVNAEIRVSSVDKAVRQMMDMGRHIVQGFPARRATP